MEHHQPGDEAKAAFMRIHYTKIKINTENGGCEIIDNFNKLSFRSEIASQQEPNNKGTSTKHPQIIVKDLDGDALFTIVKKGHEEYLIKSPWAEILGEVYIQKGKQNENEENETPTTAEIFTKDKTVRMQATRMPLIHKSNEFQVIMAKSGDVVGRINVVRCKAVVSIQPELDVFHRIRIIGTALIFLEKYNKCW